MRTRYLIPAVIVGALAGSSCASPGDVERSQVAARASYEAKIADFDDELAAAQEWNQHSLGIPASGWVAIFVISAILAAILLGVVIYYVSRGREQRRDNQHRLDVEAEKTRQLSIKQGKCLMCGADQLDALKSNEERARRDYVN